MPRRAAIRAWSLVSVALVGSVVSVAHAQTSLRATPDALPPEGPRSLVDVALLGQYARVVDPARVSGLTNLGSFVLRSRLEIGTVPSYAAGVDGEIGGSDRGLVYGLTAYPVGIGARWGDSSVVSVRGGAGFDGVVDAVPLAARFPAELSVALSLGPVRPVLWLRPSWVAGAPSRRDGSSLSSVDELEAGALVRLGRQHRYWGTASAGGGFAVGVAYRELMGTRYLGVTLGFDFTGAR